MSAASVLNPNNELARKLHALLYNITAAKGLQGIVSSNLGPRGTLKMYEIPKHELLVCIATFWPFADSSVTSECAPALIVVATIINISTLAFSSPIRLVSPGGDIKITKDGQILLKEVVRDELSCYWLCL